MEEEKKRLECAEGALRAILEICNKGGSVQLEDDWGGNSLTVLVGDEHHNFSHTHIGLPEGSFEDLVEQLKNVLTGGPGLSFHPETPDVLQ